MEWDKYKSKIIKGLNLFNFDEKILNVISGSVKNNQKIFIGGNGGSAATASHYVCDFSKGANKNWKKGKNRFQAINLSSNMEYITAISNDLDYSEIFKQQLINLASPKDVCILLSASGNSPNVIKAAQCAKNLEMIVIGITGFRGGKLKEISDYSAHIPMDSYEVCEDIHSIFGHFLTCYLRERK